MVPGVKPLLLVKRVIAVVPGPEVGLMKRRIVDGSTVTAALVAGVAVPPVGPPTVPVSVSVTVSTQVDVVPVGV